MTRVSRAASLAPAVASGSPARSSRDSSCSSCSSSSPGPNRRDCPRTDKRLTPVASSEFSDLNRGSHDTDVT